MVMQERRRYLTVEEARRLGPRTAEQRAQAEEALRGMAAIAQEILARRGGVPLSEDEILWALDRDDDDDGEGDAQPGPAGAPHSP